MSVGVAKETKPSVLSYTMKYEIFDQCLLVLKRVMCLGNITELVMLFVVCMDNQEDWMTSHGQPCSMAGAALIMKQNVGY